MYMGKENGKEIHAKSVHKSSKKAKMGAGRSRGLELARKKMESFDKQWQ
jgi:hypothetical protein